MAHMERLGNIHEAFIEECTSLDEVNDFIGQTFVDEAFPPISHEVLAITGRVNRHIGDLDVTVERYGETQYVVLMKQIEHYDTI